MSWSSFFSHVKPLFHTCVLDTRLGWCGSVGVAAAPGWHDLDTCDLLNDAISNVSTSLSTRRVLACTLHSCFGIAVTTTAYRRFRRS